MAFVRALPNRLFDGMSDDLRTRTQLREFGIEPAQIRIGGALCSEPLIGSCSRIPDSQHIEAEHSGVEHSLRCGQVEIPDHWIGAYAVASDGLPPALMQPKKILHEPRKGAGFRPKRRNRAGGSGAAARLSQIPQRLPRNHLA